MWTMRILGLALLAGGVVLGVLAVVLGGMLGGEAVVGLAVPGLALTIAGLVVLLVVAPRMPNEPRGLRRDGVDGEAKIRRVSQARFGPLPLSTGGGRYGGPTHAVCDLELEVSAPGHGRYEASYRTALPMWLLPYVLGRTIPVKVDRDRRERLFIDWEGDAGTAISGAAAGGAVPGPFGDVVVPGGALDPTAMAFVGRILDQFGGGRKLLDDANVTVRTSTVRLGEAGGLPPEDGGTFTTSFTLPGSTTVIDTNAELATSGKPAMARITRVRDLGLPVPDGRIVEVGLEVTSSARPPYPANTRAHLSEGQFDRLIVGATVAIRVDPDDPARVLLVVDGDGPEPPAAADQAAR